MHLDVSIKIVGCDIFSSNLHFPFRIWARIRVLLVGCRGFVSPQNHGLTDILLELDKGSYKNSVGVI